MPPISDRVHRILAPYAGNAVHLYLVRGAKLALIDSGAKDSPSAAVEPALRELGLRWSDLDYLINTHGHKDHLGGNGEVKAAAPQLEIGLHVTGEGFHVNPDYPYKFAADKDLLVSFEKDPVGKDDKHDDATEREFVHTIVNRS